MKILSMSCFCHAAACLLADLGLPASRKQMKRLLRAPVAFIRPHFLLLLALLPGLSGCSEPPATGPLSQRLVDVFDPEMVSGSPELGEHPPPTQWRFATAASEDGTLGWEVIQGVEGLRVDSGRLVGRSTSELPILRAVRRGGADGDDILQEIRVRMKASGGANLALHFVGAEPGPADRIEVRRFFWNAEAPIIADAEMRTYTLVPGFLTRSSGIREVYMRPVDATGGEFEIESIRLVFQREQLAEHPSGVSWHGLGGNYRETVTARAPETIRWPLTLPARPRLDLGLGVLGEQPVTFRIVVETAGGEELLAERTLTSPGRWDDVALDLDTYANESVTLALTLTAVDGTPGLWGAPAVRQRVMPNASWDDEAQGIILILTDTLRADRLSFYGHERPTAPRFSEMADAGAIFRDAHAHAPWTRVSVPALMTSLYPLSHNLRSPTDRLPSSALTMAEIFRAAGWSTAGFSAFPHTGRSANMQQGYEMLQESMPKSEYPSKTAREYVDRLLPWLERHRDERFFVFFHVFDPHFPYEPRPPFNAMWNDLTRREEHQRQTWQVAGAVANPLKGAQGEALRSELERAGVDPGFYIEYRQGWYDASIRAMDTDLGRIFERLQELGLDDRVLIALTSDHGEEFLDHDWMGHGQSLYGEMIHVPLVLRCPGLVPPGVEIAEPVQQIDVLPTLLELSGLPVPESAQGQSLVPLLRTAGGEAPAQDRAWRPKPVVSERLGIAHPMNPPPREFSSTSLIFEGWKLIHNGEGRGERPEYELYDHRTDRNDTHNVASERPEVVERLARYLEAWHRDAESRKLKSDSDLEGDLSQEELERLRALGYLQ